MARDRRFVLDANVLISALLIEASPPHRALQLALRIGRVAISAELILELVEVLQRPKFERYVTAAERDEFLTALILEGVLVEIVETVAVARDPKDNHIIALAAAAGAEAIVTGDADLLALRSFRGIAIMTPADFLTDMEKGAKP